jgi:hypothetical protein
MKRNLKIPTPLKECPSCHQKFPLHAVEQHVNGCLDQHQFDDDDNDRAAANR